MKQILIAAGAVFPFLFYLMTGRIAITAKAVEEDFLRKLNTVSFQFFFPFLIFSNVCKIDLESGIAARYILLAMVISLAALLLGWAVVPRLVSDRRRAVVIIQAIYRGNAVLFVIPLAENFFGSSGARTASLLAGIMVPFYNLIAVILLECFRGGKVSASELGRKILTNPLIISAILGLAMAALRIPLPDLVKTPVSAFASAAVPISLFALGGLIRPRRLRQDLPLMLVVSGIRLLAVPALAFAFLHFPGITREQWFCVFMVLSVPIASSSYAMAANMGGDGELAGEFVAVTTMFAPLTLFFWLLVMQSAGVV